MKRQISFALGLLLSLGTGSAYAQVPGLVETTEGVVPENSSHVDH